MTHDPDDDAVAAVDDTAAVATIAAAIAALPDPVLIATDVDGTLADIVDDPQRAQLHPGALDALWFLALSGRSISVISGRPFDDLVGLFGFPGEFVLIGSHGAEFGGPVELSVDERARLADIKRAFAKVLPSVPGAHIEHKPVAAAFHVRRADSTLADAALARLRILLAAIPGITVHEGHCVIEAAVRAVHKAAAMAMLLERVQPASVAFLGDDASDERVFEALAAADLAYVTVKVGDAPTRAEWRLPDPAAVVAVLQAVAAT